MAHNRARAFSRRASVEATLQLSRIEFFLSLFVLYTILGCLVESLGMIVITVPLLYPVLLKYGIDPVWFGIILVLFIELGQISPPIGINLEDGFGQQLNPPSHAVLGLDQGLDEAMGRLNVQVGGQRWTAFIQRARHGALPAQAADRIRSLKTWVLVVACP